MSEQIDIERGKAFAAILHQFQQDYDVRPSELLELLQDAVREQECKRRVDQRPNYKYEYLFTSEPGDAIQIDGWVPITTDRLKDARRIPELIEQGKLRPIENVPIRTTCTCGHEYLFHRDENLELTPCASIPCDCPAYISAFDVVSDAVISELNQ